MNVIKSFQITAATIPALAEGAAITTSTVERAEGETATQSSVEHPSRRAVRALFQETRARWCVVASAVARVAKVDMVAERVDMAGANNGAIAYPMRASP